MILPMVVMNGLDIVIPYLNILRPKYFAYEPDFKYTVTGAIIQSILRAYFFLVVLGNYLNVKSGIPSPDDDEDGEAT